MSDKLLQSCLILCNPIDSSPPGFPVPGILQARTPEWVAISFSNAGKWKVKVKSLSRVRLLATPWTAAYQAPPSIELFRQEYWSGVPLPSPKKPCKYFKNILLLKYTKIISNIKNHRPEVTITNIIIMKKFEIVWELPKHDIETQSEQSLLKKIIDGLAQHKVAMNLQTVLKNTISANCNKHRFCCSDAQSCPTFCDPHGLQQVRLPCSSLSPGICSISWTLSWWCYPTISSCVVAFCTCPQSFPASGSFPVSQFFTSGGQCIGTSTLASVLPMNI